MGIYNTASELFQAHYMNQVIRLARTKAGRTTLKALGINPPTQVASKRSPPPEWQQDISTRPLPRNMHPVHHENRRAARAKAYDKYSDHAGAFFVDAAGPLRNRSTATVVHRGQVVDCISATGIDITAMEEAGIALAMRNPRATFVLTDSQAAYRNFARGQVGHLAHSILQQAAANRQEVEPRTVSAVEGGQVQLNCDLRAPAADDFAVRIRWLKEHAEPGGEGDAGVTVPVYSVDVNSRTGSLSQIRQRTHLGSLRGRAYFSVIQTPAALNVDRLRSSDNGTYVCSVDFKMGWTRSAVVHLVVVVPPKRPLITDENGTEIRNLTRPYEEGEDLTLVCDVYGGQPEPVVTWWRGSQLLQQALSRAPDGHPRATLLRLRLTRADYRAKLTCRAANSNVSEASTASVIVNMHRKSRHFEATYSVDGAKREHQRRG
ncbi:hypothetical protein HPB49_002521 [Dermacentor silvarum]|uniref:Uncharacterized protein n=1 Tax=Dermacentor silvarum TaxID=543639 RepID=A0ACB8DAH7_DERSI|nr:hypothetical protein HPB49_002521 [Dermacentor silvarum]